MRAWLLRRLGLRVCGACGCVIARVDEQAHAVFHHDVKTGRMAGAVYR